MRPLLRELAEELREQDKIRREILLSEALLQNH
jgi:hypothetical protein